MDDSTTVVAPGKPGRKIVFKPWMAAALVAMVLGFALFGARPFFHWVKGARARHFAAESEAFTAEAKWREAYAKAQAACQLRPDEPEAQRAMARLFEKVNPPQAVPFLRLLAASDAAKPEDVGQYIEACLRQGNFDEASSQSSRLLQMQPGNPDALRQAARVAGARGDLEASLRYAKQAEEKQPANLAGTFLRARIEISSGDLTLQKEGWETVWKLAHDNGAVGFDSVHLLAVWPGLPARQAEELLKLLRDHPLAQEPDRLLAFQLEMRFHPEKREEILGRVTAAAKGADGTKLHALGVWLNSQGEYKTSLSLIPEKLASSRQDLFLVYLDALAALNRWKDVERLLAIKDVPLPDVYVHAFHARSAEMEGQKGEAEVRWQRAHTAATGNPAQMLYLAQYAERMGRQDQAILAYQSLAADIPTARVAYQALLRLAQERGDAAGARNLLEEMYKRWPSEPEVRNDYAYLNALLGKNLAESRGIAMGLVSALPAELPHRTSLALALLRLKDPEGAFAVYGGLNVPWERVPARDRAVWAAVLGANGRNEEANKMAKTIPAGRLFPEEKELLLPWLKQS